MNTTLAKILLLVGLLAGTLVVTGCTITTTPAAVSIAPTAPAVVVHADAPTRVYHSGRWLHYRSDGYYYSSGSSWVRATTVPTHVTRYHRPTHVSRTVSARPTHVRRTVTTSRPARTVHTGRTVSNRRTYVRR